MNKSRVTVHAAFGLRIGRTDHYYEVSLCGINGEHSKYSDKEDAVNCRRCQRIMRREPGPLGKVLNAHGWSPAK